MSRSSPRAIAIPGAASSNAQMPRAPSTVGNASLAGARLLLVSSPARTVAETLAAKVSHVSLATRPDFQEEFVRALEFDRYPKDEK